MSVPVRKEVMSMEDRVVRIEGELSTMQVLLGRIENNIEPIVEDIGELKRLVGESAKSADYKELLRRWGECAKQKDLEELAKRVEQCARREDLNKLSGRVAALGESLHSAKVWALLLAGGPGRAANNLRPHFLTGIQISSPPCPVSGSKFSP